MWSRTADAAGALIISGTRQNLTTSFISLFSKQLNGILLGWFWQAMYTPKRNFRVAHGKRGFAGASTAL